MHRASILVETHIKVACRIRPLNELEKTQGGQVCVFTKGKSIKLKVNLHIFLISNIFLPDSR